MLLLDDLSLYRNGIPHAVYDQVRRQGAVYFNDGPHPFYAVMRHAEATTVLQDTTNYSSALRGIQIEDVSRQMTPVMRAMLPYLDPPDHTILRQTLFPPLMPRQLGRFKERLEAACQSLVDQAARERDIDFVTRLAAQVPLTAFGLLMGLELASLNHCAVLAMQSSSTELTTAPTRSRDFAPP
jgi:cholest-4-en-3-one 26-monooxygenase